MLGNLLFKEPNSGNGELYREKRVHCLAFCKFLQGKWSWSASQWWDRHYFWWYALEYNDVCCYGGLCRWARRTLQKFTFNFCLKTRLQFFQNWSWPSVQQPLLQCRACFVSLAVSQHQSAVVGSARWVACTIFVGANRQTELRTSWRSTFLATNWPSYFPKLEAAIYTTNGGDQPRTLRDSHILTALQRYADCSALHCWHGLKLVSNLFIISAQVPEASSFEKSFELSNGGIILFAFVMIHLSTMKLLRNSKERL